MLLNVQIFVIKYYFMSGMDGLVSEINPNRKSPSKEQLWEFVKESLTQIGQINESYKKYFESSGAEESAPSVFGDIEAKIEKIKNAYATLFDAETGSDSRVAELNKKIEAIKEFHAELLEGETSVESEVEEAHEKINEVYEYLFGADDADAEEGANAEMREAIKHILESQKKISAFETHVETELKPILRDVQKDIRTKQEEVSALLSNATAKTLAQGYAESKGEYSVPAALPYKVGWPTYNVLSFFYNYGVRYLPFVGSYAMFVLPLVGVSFIFTNETTANIVLQSLSQNGLRPSPMELIYVKTLISVPLLWIAWYGQRNLSHKKRLFEEYNHKLRVVQMYLMFTSDAKSYKLAKPQALENILMRTIYHNASDVFGTGETMLERLAGVIRAGKETAKEVVDPLSEITKAKDL